MKNTNILLLFFFLTVFVSCSTRVLVTSHQDKKADFNQYKTFCYHGWEKNSEKMLTLSDKNFIETAFTEEFIRRGLTPVTEEGDIIVGLYIHTEQHEESVATTDGNNRGGARNGYGGNYNYGHGYGYGGYYGYGPGYGWGNSGSYTSYETFNITEGTLVCGVYETEGKKLVWESIGKEIIDEDPGARQHTFALAVDAIMAKYPISPASSKK